MQLVGITVLSLTLKQELGALLLSSLEISGGECNVVSELDARIAVHVLDVELHVLLVALPQSVVALLNVLVDPQKGGDLLRVDVNEVFVDQVLQ